jgi:hypothetical protein
MGLHCASFDAAARSSRRGGRSGELSKGRTARGPGKSKTQPRPRQILDGQSGNRVPPAGTHDGAGRGASSGHSSPGGIWRHALARHFAQHGSPFGFTTQRKTYRRAPRPLIAEKFFFQNGTMSSENPSGSCSAAAWEYAAHEAYPRRLRKLWERAVARQVMGPSWVRAALDVRPAAQNSRRQSRSPDEEEKRCPSG